MNQNTEENGPAHLFLIVIVIKCFFSWKLSQPLPFHHIHQSFFYSTATSQVEHPDKRIIKTAIVDFYSL